jgi:hypothetical protein
LVEHGLRDHLGRLKEDNCGNRHAELPGHFHVHDQTERRSQPGRESDQRYRNTLS